ncbi:hypothetical protein [Geobacillus subterraneus]|uniref:hypothetical protein n=1 Tax=Geobacillus subterraneus TaxID=129338 RepID=UPI00161BB3C0
MDRLFRLFAVRRGRGLWNQWRMLPGRRRNNNAIWALVSLGFGAAAAAMLGARRGARMAPMPRGPVQNMIRGLNRWVGRRMGTPRIATAEFAEEMAPWRPGDEEKQ